MKNDAISYDDLLHVLPHLSAIIVGPGPGSPANPSDVGILNHLWGLTSDIVIPIFGVCLGLQSLSLAYGARLKRLNVVKHGQISHIHHGGSELFKGVGDALAVRYHSLHVVLKEGGEVEQLAWADDGTENGEVVMAVKHTSKPFWAVQYHPESVRTTGGGLEVLQNFWRLAKTWNRAHGRDLHPWDLSFTRIVGPTWPYLRPHSPPSTPSGSSSPNVITTVLELPTLSLHRACDLLGANDESSPFVLLESAAEPGRFSIIGAVSTDSLRITYSVGHKHVRVFTGGEWHRESLGHHDSWSWIASFMRCRKARGGAPEIPFWGGLVGYLSYELGVDTLSIPTARRRRHHPDLNLVFVDRSIVLDKSTGKLYIQSIKPNDQAWCTNMASRLSDAALEQPYPPTRIPPIFKKKPIINLPDEALYKSRITQAKEHLFVGNSYELCLTAPTTVITPARSLSSPSSSWDFYKLLQSQNPAPHSGYLRLHPSTLVSSSPERFLSFSRPPSTKCQLRPIKGTVRKGPGITRAVAEKALTGSPKEVAENLMIVDLIRHDLHGVVGDDVTVKQFCAIEEYETVWQMVSVIEGQSTQDVSGATDLDSEGELGWEVLRRSLPPGRFLFSLSSQ